MRATPDGFDLIFTEPVDPSSAADPASYTINTYTYIYQSTYGSPEVDATTPVIKSVTVSPDRMSARLTVEGLILGHVHELHLPGIRNAQGAPLLHDAAYSRSIICPPHSGSRHRPHESHRPHAIRTHFTVNL